MEKLRLQRNEDEIYRIEVNDDGFEIVFDPLDLEFPVRLDKAYREIDKGLDILQKKYAVIEKRQDKKRDGIYSQNEYDKLMAFTEFSQKNRQIVDELFGEGTCDAVFGKRNYIGMFNDLFDALQPHLDKVYGDVDRIVNSVKKKYSKTGDDVLK